MRRSRHKSRKGECSGKNTEAVSIRERPAWGEDREVPDHLIFLAGFRIVIFAPANDRQGLRARSRLATRIFHSIGASVSSLQVRYIQ